METKERKLIPIRLENSLFSFAKGSIESVNIEFNSESSTVGASAIMKETTWVGFNLSIQINGIKYDLGEVLQDLCSVDLLKDGYYPNVSMLYLLLNSFLEEINLDTSYSTLFKSYGFFKINGEYLREYFWKILAEELEKSELCPFSLFEPKTLSKHSLKNFLVEKACLDIFINSQGLTFKTPHNNYTIIANNFCDLWENLIYFKK